MTATRQRASRPTRSPRPAAHSLLAALSAGLILALTSIPAWALVGSHGPSIGTFDVRASSLGLTLDHMQAASRTLDTLTYHTAFTSTTGRLSSQFAVHALMLDDAAGKAGYGVSAGAVTMLSLPATSRFDNGVPARVVRFWAGLVPTAVFGSIYGRIWVPVTVGAAMTMSPLRWLSFTPWAELAVGLDANADVHATNAKLTSTDGSVALSQDDVRGIINSSLKWDAGVGVGWRAGLDLALHLGDRFDIALQGGAGRLGAEVAWTGKLALIVHWDDVVPALLPSSCPVPTFPRAAAVPMADGVTPAAAP